MIASDPIVHFYSLLRQEPHDFLRDANIQVIHLQNAEESIWNTAILFREIINTNLKKSPVLLLRQIIEQSTESSNALVLVKQVLEAHRLEYPIRQLNELILHPNDSARIGLLIGVDPYLNQKNFKKPLFQKNIQDLPEGIGKTHYKNLISICQDLFKNDDRRAKILRKNGPLKTGLYLWINRLDRKSRFYKEPSKEPSEDYYVKLTILVNYLTLFLENPSIPIEGKKSILFRLSEASPFCPARWLIEAETMYRDLSHESIFQSIEDWVQCHDEDFRRNIIHQVIEHGDVHELHQYLFHVQIVINVPGGTDSLREPYQKHSILCVLSTFFKKYTSNEIVKHFLTLVNGSLIGTVNKSRLIDWFGKNIPELYNRDEEERSYTFLKEVMHEEDTDDGKHRSGDFTENAIAYLLYTYGILHIHKWTSLHGTATFGYPEIARDLLKKGIAPNISDHNGVTPLRLAIQNGHLEVVKALIEFGAPLNSNWKDGWSPLHIAVCNGHLAITKYLIECGAILNPDQKEGWSLLHAAAGKGYLEIMQYLVTLGALIDLKQKEGWSPIHIAAERGHLPIVEYLVEKKLPVDGNQKDGWTPLHLSAAKGHLNVVQYLIKMKAIVDPNQKNGWTPLHLSAQNGHLEIVDCLINAGAIIDPDQKDGWTPLHMAVQSGRLGVVTYLTSKGASIEATQKDGWTALHIAADKGHFEVLNYLVTMGAVIDSKEKDAVTPLHMAARRGYLEIVKLLLQNGADINSKNRKNWTPLHMAVCSGSLPLVEHLVERGASIDEESEWTPLHLAAHYGYLPIVKCLVTRGTSLENQNDIPLHVAVHQGHLDVAEYLLSQEAPVNAKDRDNLTPLHLSAERGDLKMIQCLISFGADTTVKNNNGLTSYEIAIQNGHVEAAKYFLKKRGWLQLFRRFSFT